MVIHMDLILLLMVIPMAIHMDPILLLMATPTDIKPLAMAPLLDTNLVPMGPLMAPMEVLTLLLDINFM